MLADLSNLNTIAFYITLICIFGFVAVLVLLLRSGRHYSVKDVESQSSRFAGIIREGHGGMTAFLWVLFAVIFIFTIVYFVLHASEFAIIFAH